MNIFDFAMKMEEDGKAFYEKMASQAGNSVIKDILLGLARDEEKHYEIFRRFRDGDLTGIEEMRTQRTKIMDEASNIFQQIASSKRELSFGADVRSTWVEAQQIEKKSEDFYREKAAEETKEGVRDTLNLIADEEHKHWVLIEHVLQFLERPKQWLEDAEWHHLEDY
jgi:rubrerythrin